MSSQPRGSLSLSKLFEPETRANPYPFYERLRHEDPVHWDEKMGFWVLSRYAEIESVYEDERFSRARGLQRGFEQLSRRDREVVRPVYDSLACSMFYTDQPYHTFLRGLVNRAFTPARVEQLRPFIQRTAEWLLDQMQGRKSMDFIRDFAYPLPVLVIAELIGFPAEDRESLKSWSDDLFKIFGTVRSASPPVEQARHGFEQMTAYVADLSLERKAHPRGDLLSALVSSADLSGEGGCPVPGEDALARGEARPLTRSELIANVNILLSAGHETTTHLLGNGLLALMQHPDQMEILRARPELLPAAIEEMLRYDSPVQISYRAAAHDAQLGGKQIREGDLLNSLLGSANRDEQRFSNPDRFDITRSEGRHLDFGLGIHFCLGAPLVRLQSEIAFGTLLRRYPRLELATDRLEWQEHPIFRGLKSLSVSL